MYAIFRALGKQFRAEKGQVLRLPRMQEAPGTTVTFDEVLLTSDGQSVQTGAPTVKGAKVLGEVVKNFRGEKIRVFKYRRREGYHRTRGHRSNLTLVKITDIVAP